MLNRIDMRSNVEELQARWVHTLNIISLGIVMQRIHMLTQCALFPPGKG